MKRNIFAMIFIAIVGLFSLSACTKYIERPEEPQKDYPGIKKPYKFTDNPPAPIWSTTGRTYLTTDEGYTFIEEMITDRGELLSWYEYNQVTGLCDIPVYKKWYEVKVRLSYGTYGDTAYYSAGTFPMAMLEEVKGQVQTGFNNKKFAVVSFYRSWNPTERDYQIYNVFR